ncbi:MAG: BTAD domain-containing putative transcriptional regulator [Gammaproteobacteria bacterium]
MTQAVQHIAKVQVPQLGNIYPRERLFNTLDDASNAKLIWLSGAAGGGKTALAANYLSTRNKPCLWYRIDEDDNDPASFFHYMAMAAKNAAPRRRKSLPLLTPEYQMGIPTFTRRFFEQVFSWLKPSSILVFDNYERVTQDSILHTILCAALEALPKEMTFLITSRQPPPAPFARLQASQHFTRIDDDALQLNREEAHQIAQIHSKQPLETKLLDDMFLLSNGWMAGLILLANAKTLPAKQRLPDASLQTLFDYFAEEVFNNIETENRHILLQLAVMPFISEASAIALTGEKFAGRILNKLAEGYFFTYRHEQEKTTYRLHPLFRVFLLEQAEQHFDSKKLASIKLKAAGLLETENYLEAAFELYTTSGQFGESARLICQQAPALLQQGRFKTLIEWISQLPSPMLEQAPWLLFWLGTGKLIQDPLAARTTLEQAYAIFTKQDEKLGAILACCSIIETFPILWDDFHKMDIWLDNLEPLLEPPPPDIPPDIESRIANAMTTGYFFRRSGHPNLNKWLARSEAILPHTPDPFMQVIILQSCYFIRFWKGELSKASLLLEQMRPGLTGKNASSFGKIWFYICECCYLWNRAETDGAIKASEKALQVSNETGVHIMDPLIHFHAGFSNASAGRLQAARNNLQHLLPLIIPGQTMNEVIAHQLSGSIAWNEGDLSQAHEALQQAAELADQAGLRFVRGTQLTGLAIVQFEQGRAKQALSTLQQVEDIAHADKIPYLLFDMSLFKAYILLKEGRQDQALKALEIALDAGSGASRMVCWWWRPQIMSTLCAVALKADIHTTYVRRIISQRGLTPNPGEQALEHWPWPVRIYTLGELRIEIAGKPLTIGKKSPAKPLELLKVLIALGGQHIKASKLADILWPEAEGDDAFESFKTTLRRLRKFLQHEETLPLKEGRLSLNRDYCWTDAHALLEPSSQNSDPQDIIRLYADPFLQDEDTAWAMQLREQLRNTYLQAVLQQGQRYQTDGQWQQAIDCYETGLSVESLTEAFYQQIILCYRQLDLPAEALHVYDRCKTVFEQEFGILPSRKTQQITQAIKDGH